MSVGSLKAPWLPLLFRFLLQPPPSEEDRVLSLLLLFVLFFFLASRVFSSYG